MRFNTSTMAVSLAAMLAAGLAAPAASDELGDVYALILGAPTNTELNLQYALIAEGQGKYRFALAAYERILANDPDNAAARRGLQRIRRIIQPPVTQVTLESGVGYATNPLLKAEDGDGGFFGFAQARIRDERTFDATRWRTTASVYVDAYPDFDQLDYAVASAGVGPVYDIPGAMAAVHPDLGGAIASLDGRFYYAEVNLGATVEGYLDGAYQWVRIRGGYRDYDASFTADSGFYADIAGRLTHPDIFGDKDAVSVAPWIRWSDMDGSIVDAASNELSPGRYLGGGARFAYDRALAEKLTVGLFLEVGDRLYTTDVTPRGDKRRDLLLSPGVTFLFSDLFGRQGDLRVEYAYQDNNSNDGAHDYENHEIKVSISKRM